LIQFGRFLLIIFIRLKFFHQNWSCE